MLFHTTSIVFAISSIVLILIDKITGKDICINWKLVLIIIIGLFFLEPLIKNIIYFVLKITRFKTYIGSQFDHGDLQIIQFIINLLLYIGMIIIINNKDINNLDKFFVNMQVLSLIFLILGKTTVLSVRLVYYFSIFQLISIPYFTNYIKTIWNNKKRIIAICVIIMIFSSSLVWTHILHTSDEILPYKTIFNKNYEFK